MRWSVNLKCAPGNSTFGMWQVTQCSFATGHGLPAGPAAARLPSVTAFFSTDAGLAPRVAWHVVQLESYELSPCFRSTWGSWQAVQASRASLESCPRLLNKR